MTEKGLVHLYYGDGKGKTTAAMGLALRALQSGKKVAVLQFLKDGSSGEIRALEKLGARILPGQPNVKFVSQMTDREKEETAVRNNVMLQEAMDTECDLLILDELCAARQYDLVDRDLARRAVLDRPQGREIVMTGRKPEKWMTDAADYVTRMCCERHPFENGIRARKGIEY